MSQPLSPQQVAALHVLRAAGSITTAEFRERVGATDDQARNLLARLEKRGCISGDGKGRTRVWTYVTSEELEIALGPAEEPGAGDTRNGSSPETGIRMYVVLEERRLDELVAEILDEAGSALTDEQVSALHDAGVIFDHVADPLARNTEHALRSAAKEVYDVAPEARPRMVAVASRMFQVEEVTVQNRQTVSIGGRAVE